MAFCQGLPAARLVWQKWGISYLRIVKDKQQVCPSQNQPSEALRVVPVNLMISLSLLCQVDLLSTAPRRHPVSQYCLSVRSSFCPRVRNEGSVRGQVISSSWTGNTFFLFCVFLGRRSALATQSGN